MNRMLQLLLAVAAFLGICACGGGGGAGASDAPGAAQAAQPPPAQPGLPSTVDVTAVDVFGAPLAGAPISFYSNSPFQQAIADANGMATFSEVRPGRVSAFAYYDESLGYGVGYSGEAELPANGHTDLHVIVRPAADPVVGSTVANIDPGGLSTDGRSLTFRFALTYVAGNRRIDYDAGMGLQVSLAECAPDGGNDSPAFQPDCVSGPSGFDAGYEVVEPVAPFVFHGTITGGTPQPYTAALLLDQGKQVALTDPWDIRLFATKYFFVQNRASDRVALAAFGADDASTGEISPLPQQPVTIFPVENGPPSFDTIDSLAQLEGGAAPLYAGIDRMLDFIAANATATGQSRMVVVLTDGRDDTCGTAAECRGARQAVVEKSLGTGIEIVTLGLNGGSLQDRRALSELTAASRGRSFWVDDPTHQLGILLGALPDVLSYYGEVVEVSFRIQGSAAGTFQSGRTVFATVLLEECPFECTNWSIPIAVPIP